LVDAITKIFVEAQEYYKKKINEKIFDLIQFYYSDIFRLK